MRRSLSRSVFLLAIVAMVLACGIVIACSSSDEPTGDPSISRTIDQQGGTVEIPGASLNIPPGALAAPTTISITRTTAAAPSGYQGISPVYRFAPDGLVFSKPVTVTFDSPPNAAGEGASIFWVNGSNVEAPSTQFVETKASALITHFSEGFLGKAECAVSTSTCAIAAKCTFLSKKCDKDDAEETTDCTCEGSKWKCLKKTKACNDSGAPSDGGVDSGGADAADAAGDAGSACSGPAGMDPTFGTGGIFYPAPDTDQWHGGVGRLAIRSGGHFVVGLYGAVARFTASGQLVWLTPLPAPTMWAPRGLSVLPNGTTIASGTRENDGMGGFAMGVAQFLPNGTIDPAFGFVSPPLNSGSEQVAGGHVVQTGGGIVVGGNGGWNSFILARYAQNGQLDTTFVPDGGPMFGPLDYDDAPDASPALRKQGFSINTYFTGVPSQLLVLPDDKLFVVGQSNNKIVIARYTAEGIPDSTFGSNGFVIASIPGLPALQIPTTAVVDASHLVIAGFVATADQAPRDFFIARYLLDGTLDTTFGTNGATVTDFGLSDSATELIRLPNGDLVAVGVRYDSAATYAGQWAMARYHSNGSLDTTFGNAGKLLLSFGPANSYSVAGAAAADPVASCGFLVAGEIAQSGGYGRPGVIRILP